MSSMRAVSVALASSRYSELEKRIEREVDPVKRAKLERDLSYLTRTARR